MSARQISIELGSKYRPDVDGLRAIAVAAVVGFHAIPRLFPGGFVGVDIFFVISGYLITRVIADDLATGTFTLSRFYARRVRRIFPALAVVLCAAALIAWTWLLPDEWRQFGKHLFAGSAFISNLALAREGGYFAWSAHFRPLLHLWSLGVEEQFYFVWPLLLTLLGRISPRARLGMLIAAVLASFALNLAFIDRYPTYTFYLPFTRLWELGLGSLLTLWRPNPTSIRRDGVELASATGLFMLAVSIVLIHENDGFPGAWALLPTIGTALVIGAGPDAWLNRTVLAARPLIFVGLISYPLYLWHWPIFSFLRIGQGGEIGAATTLVAVATSVVLAWATFRWVEMPIRSAKSMSCPLLAACSLIVVLAGIGVAAATRRIQPRLSGPTVGSIMTAVDDWTYPFGQNFGKTDGFVVSKVRGSEERAVLFIGDSHLEQYWPRVESLTADGHGPELRFVTNGGCPPLRGLAAANRRDVCREYLAFALQAARDPTVQTVVFAAYWPIYMTSDRGEKTVAASLANFGSEISTLVRLGKRVYVILSSPAASAFDPRRMISRFDGRIESQPLPLSEFRSTSGTPIEAVRDAAIAAGAEVIDPIPTLCPARECPSVTPDGQPIYRDWSHMRPFYVRERATFIDRVLR